MMGLSRQTVIRIFEKERGVLILGRPERKSNREMVRIDVLKAKTPSVEHAKPRKRKGKLSVVTSVSADLC
jgi:hypothetical protein